MWSIDIKSKLKSSDHDIFIVQFVSNCSVFLFTYVFCFALIKTVMPLTTIDSMAVQYIKKKTCIEKTKELKSYACPMTLD